MIPHDPEAEMAVLGACMVNRAWRDQTLATLTADDFYLPENRAVFVAIMRLHGAGEPADAGALGLILTGKKDHILAANASAPLGLATPLGIVADRAARRRLLALAEGITARANTLDDDPADIVAELERSTETVRLPVESTPPPLELDAFLAIEDSKDEFVIPKCLARGDRLMITSGEGVGKALAIDTPIPTPEGWRTMGDLEPGDHVFGVDGRPTRVVAVTPVLDERPCYRVRFSDDAELIADGNHRWLTETLLAREHRAGALPAVVTTEAIAATLKARGGHTLNHAIQVCAPLEYPAQELPIDPYLLGAWLGDGTSADAAITCADDEIIDRIREAGWIVERMVSGGPYYWRIRGERRWVGSLNPLLRELGVLGDKHIPEKYQRASVAQRIALLQGLMDTDGTVSDGGHGSGRGSGQARCEFSVCSKRLAHDAHELMLGLGIKVTMRSGPAKLNGVIVATRYRLSFQTDLPVFHLSRKAERLSPLRTRRAKLRYITAVEPVPSVPVRCIQVAAGDGMFLAGSECIPTHNSELQLQMAVCVASGVHPFFGYGIRAARVLVVDLENSARQLRKRLPRLRDVAGDNYRGLLRIETRGAGINLRDPRDARWLDEKLEQTGAELLVIGPLYKMFRAKGSESKADETAAEEAAYAIDRLRVRHNVAVSIEAHSPHGHQGDRENYRPIGASLWMRWPEFGLALKPVAMDPKDPGPIRVDVKHWRGARDRDRSWPSGLITGGPSRWPWLAEEAA